MLKRYIFILMVLALVVTACAQGADVEPPAEPQTEAASAEEAAPVGAPTQYSEAPGLAELVAAGELPSVDERLPTEPFIVGPGVIVSEEELPDWTPGQYGGSLRFAHGNPNWNPDVFIMLNEPFLMAPGIGVAGIRGNVAKDFEVEDDNKVFTFHMREGLKWSDGEPVTTEDVRFVYEDIYLNEKVTASFPVKFKAAGKPDGEPMTLEIIGDYTFRITFAEPYGGFLRELTIKGWQGYTDLVRPAHHLKQFHPTYTPLEELKPLLEEQGLEDEWWQLFNQKDCTNWEVTRAECTDYPSLTPWVKVESPSGIMTFERNPYYFKVDTEGQQLPYIDDVVSVEVGDVEAVNLKLLTGEVDFLREDTALIKLPLYKENEEKAGIRITLLETHVDPTALFLNYTYDDPVWREVVNNVQFRKALNMSIKRQEIIDSVYFGLASPPELVPGDYNVEEANQILDEIGLDQRDDDGFRLGPDGNTFIIPIEFSDAAPDIPPVAELLVEHFKDVGIKTTIKQIDGSLLGQRADANELQATILWSVQPMWRDGTWTDYIPTSRWGRAWQIWYNTSGAEGEEPPADIKKLYEIHEGRVQAIPASLEDKQLTEDLYAAHYDNVYVFNIAEKVNYALVTNAKLGNVQIAGQAIGSNNSGEQFFYKE